MVSGIKNAAKVRAGEIGARKRWGPPRVVRLDQLTAEQARLIRALVDAARKEKAAPTIVTVGAAQEARRVRDEPSAA